MKWSQAGSKRSARQRRLLWSFAIHNKGGQEPMRAFISGDVPIVGNQETHWDCWSYMLTLFLCNE